MKRAIGRVTAAFLASAILSSPPLMAQDMAGPVTVDRVDADCHKPVQGLTRAEHLERAYILGYIWGVIDGGGRIAEMEDPNSCKTSLGWDNVCLVLPRWAAQHPEARGDIAATGIILAIREAIPCEKQ
jgi:Rap1a immunity proteins